MPLKSVPAKMSKKLVRKPRPATAPPIRSRAHAKTPATSSAKSMVGVLQPTVAELRRMIERDVGTHRILLTPALVDELLSRNSGNRTLSMARAQRFATDMEEGRWLETGEPLIMSREGILNTGQHRLTALQLYEKPMVMDVRFGVPREAFVVTDTGRSHSARDVLVTIGVSNSALVAAVLRLLILYDKGLPTSAHRATTNDEVAVALKQWPDVPESVRRFLSLPGASKSPHFRTSAVAAVFFMAETAAGREKAMDFIKIVSTGLTSDADNPARRLYERLQNDIIQKTRLNQIEKLGLAIKAWNLYSAGKRTQNLRIRTAGPATEVFPVIEGFNVQPSG